MMNNLGAAGEDVAARATAQGDEQTGPVALPSLESLKPMSLESLPLKAHQKANVAHYNSCSVLPGVKTYCGMSLESFHLLLATHRAGRKPKSGQRLSR